MWFNLWNLAFSREEYPLSGGWNNTVDDVIAPSRKAEEYATFAYGWEMRSRDNSAIVYTLNEEIHRASSRALLIRQTVRLTTMMLS